MLCNKLSQTSRLKIYYIYYLSTPRLGVWHSLSASSAMSLKAVISVVG